MDDTLAGTPVRELAHLLTQLADRQSVTFRALNDCLEPALACAFRQLAVLGALLADRLDELASRPGLDFEHTLADCLLPWLDATDLAVRLAGAQLAGRSL